MKRLLLSVITGISTCHYAQVGINTTSPKATLDVVTKNPTGTSTTPDGLLIPRVDRQRAQSMSGVAISTLIYINNASTGSQTNTAANIDATGYYYFNGTAWIKLNEGSATPNNIYTTDGTLAGNRVVTQADKKLSFTATSTDAFNVAAGTLSVDAANKRVGVGTTTPTNILVVRGNNAQPSALGTATTNATFRVDGNTNHALDMGTLTAAPYGSYIGSQNKTGTAGLPLAFNPQGGNVGIGTITPNSTLVVEGSYEGAYKQVSSDTTLGIESQFITAVGSSPVTITLPDGTVQNSFSGRVYNIKNNSSENITLKGFSSNQLIAVNSTTSQYTYTIPPGYYTQAIKNSSSTAGTALWDLSFLGISQSDNVKTLTYIRNQTSPIDSNTPTKSVVTLGDLLVRYNGTTPTSAGYIEYQVLSPSHVTVWYRKAGSGGTGLDKYGQTAASSNTWYKLAYQTGNNGNNITPSNRDASETILILHNSNQIYRITSNANGDIPASNDVPSVASSVTLFVEKLD